MIKKLEFENKKKMDLLKKSEEESVSIINTEAT